MLQVASRSLQTIRAVHGGFFFFFGWLVLLTVILDYPKDELPIPFRLGKSHVVVCGELYDSPSGVVSRSSRVRDLLIFNFEKRF